MIKTNDLIKLQEILNIAALAEKSGLNKSTLRGKISRGTELTVTESEALERTFRSYQISFDNSLSAAPEKINSSKL